jgi:hypothetical protein
LNNNIKSYGDTRKLCSGEENREVGSEHEGLQSLHTELVIENPIMESNTGEIGIYGYERHLYLRY